MYKIKKAIMYERYDYNVKLFRKHEYCTDIKDY